METSSCTTGYVTYRLCSSLPPCSSVRFLKRSS
uniref:Uncharacterized protein n=1 Tax=CrAss-like virus sp. ctRQZ5 TaxID=2826824 RepID=A0A8S5LXW3_9CAUD|nr:MAG TPA: hypothetical protein [CrAss-like virus sp. ctRQZ5]DAW93918.1 MAG TPA: hypothetical protein [Caudoviricetes sp.]